MLKYNILRSLVDVPCSVPGLESAYSDIAKRDLRNYPRK
jgi:hypothetical protein